MRMCPSINLGDFGEGGAAAPCLLFKPRSKRWDLFLLLGKAAGERTALPKSVFSIKRRKSSQTPSGLNVPVKSIYAALLFALACILRMASRCASSICPLRIMLSIIDARCCWTASRCCRSSSFCRRSWRRAARCCSAMYAAVSGGVTSLMINLSSAYQVFLQLRNMPNIIKHKH